MEYFILLLTFLGCYLFGSIPNGYIITKIFTGKDIRNYGTGNIDATNIFNYSNRFLAPIVALFDAAKGYIVFYTIKWLENNIGGRSMPIHCFSKWDCVYEHQIAIIVYIVIGGALLLGHIFPVWLKFRGGNGVAVYFGMLLGIVGDESLLVCAIWLITIIITRKALVAAIISIGLSPLYLYALSASGYPEPVIFCLATAPLILLAAIREIYFPLKVRTDQSMGMMT